MSDATDGWQIIFKRKARRMLVRLPRDIQIRLGRAINQLAKDPRPPGCKRLVGTENLYRIRVGDWRVIYAIEDEALVVLVLKVASRGSAYQD